jgi:thiol-disulfide isomerase/thioredoxin
MISLKKRWHYWLIYIVLFLIVMLAANGWKTRNTPDGNLSGFSGILMDGSAFSISEFSGQPILFHFWATWCPICDLEKNSVQSISQDYPVITIASWSKGKAQVQSYMLENKLTFPVMLDNSGALAKTFGLQGVPASFILNPQGEITFVESGYTTELGLRLRLWLSTF